MPNPAFIDSAETGQDGPMDAGGSGDTSAGTDASDSSDSTECPPGWLDCDDQPGCESNVEAPESCGSCDNPCEVEGQLLDCVSGTCTGTVTLAITQDAYVDADLGDQNFGSGPALLIDATRDTYVMLPDLDSIPQGADFLSITLQLECTQAGGTIGVHEVGGGWDEFTLTHSNTPGLDGATLASFTPSVGTTSVELLGLINEWRLGSPKRSLGLRAEAPSPTTELSSHEGPIAPYLEVEISW